ncbi:MAG: hypothetical protein EAZ30_17620 [Betaproteobacteria bacterium]|nr:MAG: hypothetical protein EAZ30_17620 [Betaproteobacteria bacterium]
MASKAPPSKPNAVVATLPAQIEIFRAGRHTDDSGTVHNFSAADVSSMAAAYDPALREAPLTIGHPEHNLPAYGWVKGLEMNAAGNLAMNTHQVAPQFAEMVASKAFKKRSASFYPPGHASNPKPDNWYLRHVAFLGAQPPAIAGLADFADTGAEGAVSFSEGAESASPATANLVIPVTPATTPVTTEPTQEQLRMTQQLTDQLAAANAKQLATDAALATATAATAAANAQLAQFAESAKRDRTAGFASFAEAQIKAGVLLPKDKDAAVAVLDALADSQPVSFAEGGATKTVSPAEWLKNFIASRVPVISFGEHAAGNAGNLGNHSTTTMTEAEIDTKAKAYARQHKVDYKEALSAVVSFTA